MPMKTSLKVDSKVRDRLNQFKRGPETASDALDRALDIAERRIAAVNGRIEDA